VQNRVFGTRRTGLASVDYRLRYVLLEEVDPRMRRILERLFCTSLEQLQAGIERKAACLRLFEDAEKITEFRTRHMAEMQVLGRILRRHFREMDNGELDYRSHVFKGLRKTLNGWTLQRFFEKYREKYKDDTMSVPTICRMEQRTRKKDPNRFYKTPLNQRRKDIGEAKALRIADVYEVDPGLFLPAIVSSRY